MRMETTKNYTWLLEFSLLLSSCAQQYNSGVFKFYALFSSSVPCSRLFKKKIWRRSGEFGYNKHWNWNNNDCIEFLYCELLLLMISSLFCDKVHETVAEWIMFV